ncbi:MAG: hypothetical protein WC655_13955 [Candidatus Hydrogenedentales bacterium]
MQIMTPDHQKWNEFYRHLGEMADLSPCQHTMNAMEVTLTDAFGFTPEEVFASIVYFRENRAHCDCEVLLRFGTRAMDELAQLRAVVRSLDQRIASLGR